VTGEAAAGGAFSAPDASQPICSRAGCRLPAVDRIEWRNPRIHAEDRVKVWLGCAEHAPWLLDYLVSRDFPARIVHGVNADDAEIP